MAVKINNQGSHIEISTQGPAGPQGADGSGDVVGPASATDDNLAKFDGATGKLIKDGPAISAFGVSLIDDASASTARTTLGLGTAATTASTAYATAAQGTTADSATQPGDISGLTGGTTGQIATKATADDYDLAWSDSLTVPGILTADHIHGNMAGTLYTHVKNTSGGTLAKGTPVYVTGHVGASDSVEVAAADQSDSAKMPAIAILEDELLNNGQGNGVIVGEIRTFDTTTPSYALNDELFVGAGSLTSTRPTSGTVQSIATVGRLKATTGVLVVNCQGQRPPSEAFAPALGADDNYVTDAEKVVVGNTSGINTGDQDLTPYNDGQLDIVIDGAGTAIATGYAGALRIPYDCTISGVELMADQSGSIVIDVWKDTYANAPLTDADSITASSPPTLSTAQKSVDSTLTGWTTALTKGDYLAFNVDSTATITRITLTLIVSKV